MPGRDEAGECGKEAGGGGHAEGTGGGLDTGDDAGECGKGPAAPRDAGGRGHAVRTGGGLATDPRRHGTDAMTAWHSTGPDPLLPTRTEGQETSIPTSNEVFRSSKQTGERTPADHVLEKKRCAKKEVCLSQRCAYHYGLLVSNKKHTHKQ